MILIDASEWMKNAVLNKVYFNFYSFIEKIFVVHLLKSS